MSGLKAKGQPSLQDARLFLTGLTELGLQLTGFFGREEGDESEKQSGESGKQK